MGREEISSWLRELRKAGTAAGVLQSAVGSVAGEGSGLTGHLVSTSLFILVLWYGGQVMLQSLQWLPSWSE